MFLRELCMAQIRISAVVLDETRLIPMPGQWGGMIDIARSVNLLYQYPCSARRPPVVFPGSR